MGVSHTANRNSHLNILNLVWRKQTNHTSYFYFCLNNAAEYSSKNRANIVVPDIPLFIINPVPPGPELPIPVHTKNVFQNALKQTEQKDLVRTTVYRLCLFYPEKRSCRF